MLVLGGASEIGVAIAEALARRHHPVVVLAGRHADRLESAAAAVRAAGATRVDTLAFDAEETAGHEAVVAGAEALGGPLDVVVLAFGVLGDGRPEAALRAPAGAEPTRAAPTRAAPDGAGDALRVARTNYVGAVSVGLAVARALRRQGHGTLVVLSSVAGERVRSDNLVYGSSKAGLDGFAQGLGDALAGSGANVLIVRPGFVLGRMTAGRRPTPMATTPQAVAEATASALARRKDVVWVPPALRVVFAVARHLPRSVWRRLPERLCGTRSG